MKKIALVSALVLGLSASAIGCKKGPACVWWTDNGGTVLVYEPETQAYRWNGYGSVEDTRLTDVGRWSAPGYGSDGKDYLFWVNHQKEGSALAYIDLKAVLHYNGMKVPNVVSGFALPEDAYTPECHERNTAATKLHGDHCREGMQYIVGAENAAPTYVVKAPGCTGTECLTVGWGTQISPVGRYEKIRYLSLISGVDKELVPVWVGVQKSESRQGAQLTETWNFEFGIYGQMLTSLDCRTFKGGMTREQAEAKKDEAYRVGTKFLSRPSAEVLCDGFHLMYAFSRTECGDKNGGRVCTTRYSFRIGDTEMPLPIAPTPNAQK